MHYVVVWEPRGGHGGGHQLALDLDKAERIQRVLSRAVPDAEVRIEPAEAYAAAAVLERLKPPGSRRADGRLRT
jgi:hypothetical protein